MLTKNDLQNIGKLVDERLDKKLDKKFKPIQQKLNSVDEKVSRVDKNLTDLSEYVIPALGNIFKWTDDIHKALIGKSPRAINEN